MIQSLVAPFTELSATEKSWVVNNITGGNVPITLYGVTKPKAIWDTIIGLNLGLNALQGLVRQQMTGLYQTKALVAINSLYAQTNSLSTFPQLFTLNATYYNTLIASGVFAKSPSVLKSIFSVDLTVQILHYVNLDSYVPDLTALSNFWVTFGSVYLYNTDPAFLNKISTSTTQAQVEATAASFVIPSTAAGVQE